MGTAVLVGVKVVGAPDEASVRLLGVTNTDDSGQNTNDIVHQTLGAAGGTASFYGAAPAAQPTITGSKGANAALTSLITQLAALGLIVDGTT
jgi:hypothetical protein